MSFHTEYRPKTFEDVIGNSSTVKSLQSLFKSGKLVSHVFLFHGKSGCGKTTFGRILADMLGCSEHDYQEINIGNNRGIDTAREILKTVNYLPTQGDNKIILLDEVHSSSKDFQGALLKVLEDTPQHVYFVLCTTEPQKLLPTIKRRCVSYEMESLTDKELSKLLKTVAKKEKQELLKKVKHKLIEKAEGCPAIALVLLEQIIYLDPKDQLKAIKVFKTQEQKTIDLCKAILKKEKWFVISKILSGITDEPETVRRAILGYINSGMVKGWLKEKDHPHCMLIYIAFRENYFNTGKAGLTFSCYRAVDY